MFNSLDEEMRRDDKAASTPRERWTLYATVLLVSLVLFGALFAGIRYFE